jgi:hypothetical protein
MGENKKARSTGALVEASGAFSNLKMEDLSLIENFDEICFK